MSAEESFPRFNITGLPAETWWWYDGVEMIGQYGEERIVVVGRGESSNRNSTDNKTYMTKASNSRIFYPVDLARRRSITQGAEITGILPKTIAIIFFLFFFFLSIFSLFFFCL